jgi:pyridoxal phosphate-dependent aminotransferase EpsN
MGENEFRYVREAFESNWLSTVGPNLDALEGSFRELTGLPCVALVNGTAGIHLGCRLLGIGPGDEVVTPTLTFAASCNPLLYVGARPVFIDCERATWNLDPNLLEEFLRRRAERNRLPKAVEVVHLFGQSADMDAIGEICARYDLPVLEDAAESLGARYKGRMSGTFGAVSVFSFNGNKTITGTSGGMLCSANEEWVERARHWSGQACDPDPEGINNYVQSELGVN